MNSGARATSREGSASPGGARSWLRGVLAVVEMEVRKIGHDPSEVLLRSFQPVFWLFIFGGALGRVRSLPTSGYPYQAFITPGILAQSLMVTALFYGIAIIWEKDLGILQKFLVLPVPRSVFVLGKSLAASFRALTQSLVILAIAGLAGIPLRWSAPGLLGVVLTVVLSGVTFASFSMILAAVLKKRERFMGFGQLFIMPLFFASNALYPVSIMPGWLRALARANPLTYTVDLLRSFLVTGDYTHLLLDLAVLGGSCLVTTAVATRLYPRAAW